MLADHIVMSSGCVCTAIKPGSTSVYMCKTHFPQQQGHGMKGKVRENAINFTERSDPGQENYRKQYQRSLSLYHLFLPLSNLNVLYMHQWVLGVFIKACLQVHDTL